MFTRIIIITLSNAIDSQIPISNVKIFEKIFRAKISVCEWRLQLKTSQLKMQLLYLLADNDSEFELPDDSSDENGETENTNENMRKRIRTRSGSNTY